MTDLDHELLLHAKDFDGTLVPRHARSAEVEGTARPVGVLDHAEGIVAVFLLGQLGVSHRLSSRIHPLDLGTPSTLRMVMLLLGILCLRAWDALAIDAKEPPRHVDIVDSAIHKDPA